MTTSLNYAPTTPFPIRLWPLALGAAVIALGTVIPVAGVTAPLLFGFSIATNPSWQSILSLINGLAILAAIPLLAAALPHEEPVTGRGKMSACLALAAALVLLRCVILANSIAVAFRGGPAAFDWTPFIHALGCVSYLLQLALLASAGIYFFAVAKCCGRKPLGIIAACGLAPCALMILLSLAYTLMRLIAGGTSFLTNVTFMKIVATCSALNVLWHTLFWTAIALFAAILALKKPQRNPTSP
jgi:hypothetical protein